MNKLMEIERRWLIGNISGDTKLDWKKAQLIHQGYLSLPGLRVRVYEDYNRMRYAELTQKKGVGTTREETNMPIQTEAAELLITVTPYTIRKTRYFYENWEINIYLDNFFGLKIAEKNLFEPNEPVTIPDWMIEPYELTGVLTDETLSKIASQFTGKMVTDWKMQLTELGLL